MQERAARQKAESGGTAAVLLGVHSVGQRRQVHVKRRRPCAFILRAGRRYREVRAVVLLKRADNRSDSAGFRQSGTVPPAAVRAVCTRGRQTRPGAGQGGVRVAHYGRERLCAGFNLVRRVRRGDREPAGVLFRSGGYSRGRKVREACRRLCTACGQYPAGNASCADSRAAQGVCVRTQRTRQRAVLRHGRGVCEVPPRTRV